MPKAILARFQTQNSMLKPRVKLHPFVATFLLVWLIVPLAIGAEFWAKKPYQSWSAEQTAQILAESPWATTLKLTGLQSVIGTDSPNHHPYRSEMESNPSISYTLQFRSALPIRQAEVRNSQLSSHYDAMKPEQKAAFDASVAKFLGAAFPDRVIVTVTFHSNVLEYQSFLRSYWASQSVPKLDKSVFLNARNERLSLIGYGFKEDTFQFTFPRPKQVTPDDKLGVEFVHPKTNAIGQQRVFQEFQVKKMLIDNEPSF